jgi:hypothetical protein
MPSNGAIDDDDGHLGTAVAAVVVIDGEFENGTPTQGAGIVVGRERDVLYVVTANHVVRHGAVDARELRVTLRRAAGTPRAARLLPRPDPALDVAVLAVQGVPRAAFDVCSELDMLPAQGDAGAVRGAKVLPIGHPNGVAWALPAVPDAISQADADRIVFQSTILSPGHSGGPLLTPGGTLLGLITQDAPPFGVALPAPRVLDALRKAGVPVQIVPGYRDWNRNWSAAFPVYTPQQYFFKAVRDGDVPAVESALARCDPDRGGESLGGTLLGVAAENSRSAVVRLLLRAGASPRVVGPNGWTPLHSAAESGDVDSAAALLDAGADPNALAAGNLTPLFVAKQKRRNAVVALLVRRGAR